MVYGATPSGVAAAVNAAKEGAAVILFEELYQAGGMLSGGLGYIDFRPYESCMVHLRNTYTVWLATKKYGPRSKQVHQTDGGLQAEPHGWREVPDPCSTSFSAEAASS